MFSVLKNRLIKREARSDEILCQSPQGIAFISLFIQGVVVFVSVTCFLAEKIEEKKRKKKDFLSYSTGDAANSEFRTLSLSTMWKQFLIFQFKVSKLLSILVLILVSRELRQNFFHMTRFGR